RRLERRGLILPVLRRALRGRRATGSTLLSTIAALTLAASAEQLHLLGDDVGVVPLLPVLAGDLLVADRAFDVDLATFADVLAGDLTQLAEQLDAVPFGALLYVAVAVLARTACRQSQRAHGQSRLGVLHFRIVAGVADEDDAVDSTGHGSSPVYSGCRRLAEGAVTTWRLPRR